MTRHYPFLLAVPAALLSVNWAQADLPNFVGTGIKPNSAYGSSVSSDGHFVVGADFRGPRGQTPNNFFLNNKVVRWSSEEDPLVLDINGFPMGVSDDGSIIIGNTWANDRLPLKNAAFRWTEAGGVEYLAPGHETSHAAAMSHNGNEVVGSVSPDVYHPAQEVFRWTTSGGLQVLGGLPGSDSNSPVALSADGAVVVGTAGFFGDSTYRAFKWTEETGIVQLGTPPPGTRDFAAYGATPDMSVVVGYLTEVQYVQVPAYWTEATGWVAIPDLPGGNTRTNGPVLANAVSADGSIIVGRGVDETGVEPFIWDAARGTRNLTAVLRDDYGLTASLAGWNLSEATAISDDGRIITGYGRNPSGDFEYWVADLGAPVPEPSTIPLIAITVTTLTGCQRSRVAPSIKPASSAPA
jgi:probable HAF family extracellular repeat protein